MTIERILPGLGSAIPASPAAKAAAEAAPERRVLRDPLIEDGAEREPFVAAVAGLAPPGDPSLSLDIARLVAGLMPGRAQAASEIELEDRAPPPDVRVAMDLRPGVGVVETTIVDGLVTASVVVAPEPPREASAAADRPAVPPVPVLRAAASTPDEAPRMAVGDVLTPAAPDGQSAAAETPRDAPPPDGEAAARLAVAPSSTAPLDDLAPIGAMAGLASAVEHEAPAPGLHILNAAMIPGWPPPRPLVAPEPRPAGPTAPAPDPDLVAQMAGLGVDRDTLDFCEGLLKRRPRLARRLLARLGLAVALLESILATITEELEELFAERDARDTGRDLRHRKPGSDRVYVE